MATPDTPDDTPSDTLAHPGAGQLCAACRKPLGEKYLRLGRTTRPGCRAQAGGAR
jgi:hypothetical protein